MAVKIRPERALLLLRCYPSYGSKAGHRSRKRVPRAGGNQRVVSQQHNVNMSEEEGAQGGRASKSVFRTKPCGYEVCDRKVKKKTERSLQGRFHTYPHHKLFSAASVRAVRGGRRQILLEALLLHTLSQISVRWGQRGSGLMASKALPPNG